MSSYYEDRLKVAVDSERLTREEFEKRRAAQEAVVEDPQLLGLVGDPQARVVAPKSPADAKDSFDLGKAIRGGSHLQNGDGLGTSPLINDGPGQLPLTTPPLADSTGKQTRFIEQSVEKLTRDMITKYEHDNKAKWLDLPLAEREKREAEFEKKAFAQVKAIEGQSRNDPSPGIVYDPAAQREAVRQGFKIPFTDVRPGRFFDAAIITSALTRATGGTDEEVAEAYKAAQVGSQWTAPFAMVMERGVHQAESGTGELVKETAFQHFMRMSPYTALAPWLAGKLTDKYKDVEWGSDEHLELIQAGKSWMDFGDVPGQILEEQYQNRLKELFGFDIVGTMMLPGDVLYRGGAGAASLTETGVRAAAGAAYTASTAIGTQPYIDAVAGKARDAAEYVGVVGPRGPDDGKEHRFTKTLEQQQEDFKWGEASGAKALTNLVTLAPFALVEPDALSGATLGLGKGFKLARAGLRQRALLTSMDVASNSVEAGVKAVDVTTTPISDVFRAVREGGEVGMVGEIAAQMVRNKFAAKQMMDGGLTGAELGTVKSIKDPAQALASATAEANSALGVVNTALNDLRQSRAALATYKAQQTQAQATLASYGLTKNQIDKLSKLDYADLSRRATEMHAIMAKRQGLLSAKGVADGAKPLVGAILIHKNAAKKLTEAAAARSAAQGVYEDALKRAVIETKGMTKGAAKDAVRKQLEEAALAKAQQGIEAVQAQIKTAQDEVWRLSRLKNDRIAGLERHEMLKYMEALRVELAAEEAAAKRASAGVQAADRRLAAAKEAADQRMAKEATKAGERARKTESVLGSTTKELDASAKAYTDALDALDAAKAAVPQSTVLKYGTHSVAKLEKEIASLAGEIRATKKIDPRKIANLTTTMNYVQHLHTVQAIEAQVLKLEQASGQLLDKWRVSVSKAQKAQRTAHLAGAATRSRAILKEALQETADEIAEFKRLIKKHGDVPQRGKEALVTPTDTLLSKSFKALDTGEVLLDVPAQDFMASLAQKYGNTPIDAALDAFIKKGTGTVDEYRAALDGEVRMAVEFNDQASKAYRSGQLIDDTLVQAPGLANPGRKLNAASFAVNYRRTTQRLGLLRPIPSLGMGMVGEAGEAIYRKAFELARSGEIQITKLLEQNGATGMDAVRDLLFTNKDMMVNGERMMLNSGGSTPFTKARQHLEELAKGGEETFKDSVVAQGIAHARLPSGQEAKAAASAAVRDLYEKALAGMTDADLLRWMERDSVGIYNQYAKAADMSPKADLFFYRSIAAGSNAHDVTRAMIQLGWDRPLSPPNGVLNTALEYIRTGTGGLSGDAKRISEDLSAQAMEEAMQFQQRFSTGISDARVVSGQGVIGRVADDVGTKLQMDALVAIGDRTIFVPPNIRRALNAIPDAIAKEATQRSVGVGNRIMDFLTWQSRVMRMAMVGGLKLPRLAIHPQAQLGDAQQMAMHPEIGPMMAGRVAQVGMWEVVPGIGPKIRNYKKLPPGARPMFTEGLDDTVRAVISGDADRLVMTAEGPISARALQKEAIEHGMSDSLPQKDLLDAVTRNRVRAQDDTIGTMNKVFNWLFEQSDITKASMKILEAEQQIKRTALFVELRKAHSAQEAGRIAREAMVDWSLGVSRWETETIARVSAFHSYRRGKWNLLFSTIGKDIAGIETGKAASFLFPGTAMPMKWMRASTLPSHMRDRERREAKSLDDRAQFEALSESQRSEYSAHSGLLNAEMLSEGFRTKYQMRSGKTVDVAQLHIAQGSFEDMMMDLAFQYDVLYWTGHKVSAKLMGQNDYEVPESADAMAYRVVKYITDSFAGDPQLGFIAEKAAFHVAGVADPYEKRTDTVHGQQSVIPPQLATIITSIGLDEYVNVERNSRNELIYSTEPEIRDWILYLYQALPHRLDSDRYVKALDNPEWEKGYLEGLLRSMLLVSGVVRQEYANSEKQIDMNARTRASKIQLLEGGLDDRANPELNAAKRR